MKMDARAIDNKAQEILNRVQQNISSPKLAMVVDKDGKILECIITDGIGKIVDLTELTYIAKMIAIRYDVAGYHTILNGLQMDVSVFKHVFALSILMKDDNLLIVIVPKTVDVYDIIHTGEDINNFSISPLSDFINK